MEMEDSNLGPTLEEIVETPILIPCTICGRTFKSESLRIHQGVCQKNATKKRKVFDSMKQRIQGTELAEYIPIPVVPPKPKLISVNKVAGSKSSRDRHRQIGESPHVNTPGSSERSRPLVRSNSMSTSTPSRSAALKEERCPHCDRTFGWKAFSRHEEWCREHKSRYGQSQSPAAVLKAKEMLEVRIKYRAPLVGKSKRPTNREKYAAGACMVGSSPMSHSLPKSSVSDVHLQNLSSPKTNIRSSSKENRNRSNSKTSTVSCPGISVSHPKPVMRKISAPVKREASPSKEVTHIINPPWDLNISNDGVTEGKESTSSSRNRVNHQERNNDSIHKEANDKKYNTGFNDEELKKDEELVQWVKNAKFILNSMEKNPPKCSTEKKSCVDDVDKASDRVKREEDDADCRYNLEYFRGKNTFRKSHNDHVYDVGALIEPFGFDGNDSQKIVDVKSNAKKNIPTDSGSQFIFENNVDKSSRFPIKQIEAMFEHFGQGDIDHSKFSTEDVPRTFVFKILESSDGSNDCDQLSDDRFEEITENFQVEKMMPTDQVGTIRSVEFIPDSTPIINQKPGDQSQKIIDSKRSKNSHVVKEIESKRNRKNIKSSGSFGKANSFNELSNSTMPKLNNSFVKSEGVAVAGVDKVESTGLVTWKDISQSNSNEEENEVEKQQCKMSGKRQYQELAGECTKKIKRKCEMMYKKQTCPLEKEKKKPECVKNDILSTTCEKSDENKISKSVSVTVEKNGGVDRRRSKLPLPVPKYQYERKINIFNEGEENFNKSSPVRRGKKDSTPLNNKPKYFKNLNSTFIISNSTFETLEESCLHHPTGSKLNQDGENSSDSSSNESSVIRKGVIYKVNPEEYEMRTWAEVCENRSGISKRYPSHDLMQSEYCYKDENVFEPVKNENSFDANSEEKTDNETGKVSEKEENYATSSSSGRNCKVKKRLYSKVSCTDDSWVRSGITLNSTPLAEKQKSSVCRTNENYGVSNNEQPNDGWNNETGLHLERNNYSQSLNPAEVKADYNLSPTSCNSKESYPNSSNCCRLPTLDNNDAPLSLEDLSTNTSNFVKTQYQSAKTEGLYSGSTYVLSKQIGNYDGNFADIVGTPDGETQSDDGSYIKKYQSTSVPAKPQDVSITSGGDPLDKKVIVSNEKFSITQKNENKINLINSDRKKMIAKDSCASSCQYQKDSCEESEPFKLITEQENAEGSGIILESDNSKANNSEKSTEEKVLCQENESTPQNKENEGKHFEDVVGNRGKASSVTTVSDLVDTKSYLEEINSDLNKNSSTESFNSGILNVKENCDDFAIKKITCESRESVANKECLKYPLLSENSTSVSICSSPVSSHNISCKKNTIPSTSLKSIMNKYSSPPHQVCVETNLDSSDITYDRLQEITLDEKIKTNIYSNYNISSIPNSDVLCSNEESKKSSKMEKDSTGTDCQNLPSGTNEGDFEPSMYCQCNQFMIEDGSEPIVPPQNHLPVINTSNDSDIVSAQMKWLDLVQEFDERDSNCVESLIEVQKVTCSKPSGIDGGILDLRIAENKVKRRLFEGEKSLKSNACLGKLLRSFEARKPLESSLCEKEEMVNRPASNQFSRQGRKIAEERIKKRLIESSALSSQDISSPYSKESSSRGYSPSQSKCPSRKELVSPCSKRLPSMKPVSHDFSKGSSCQISPSVSTTHHLKSFEDDQGGGLTPVEKPSFRLSTYDPFSKAEMQLRELLSDGSDFQKPRIVQSTPIKEPHENQIPDTHNLHNSHVDSTHENDNLKVHNILNNQKQAKEDVLPDLFTETSAQLHFEMPNLMRGREESVMTKRRAMKPTPQNMGIELNTNPRENVTERRGFVTKTIDTKSENQQENFTSIEDMGNKVTKNSNSVKSNMKLESGDQLDIDSIHQSINLVALGLSNLSTHSHESLIDVDNNNTLSEGKTMTGKSGNVDSSGNLLEVEQSIGLSSHPTHPASSGESDGDGKRIRRRKKRGKTVQEGEIREEVSSPDSLVTFQNPISAKISVDSAYSSLNRPSFRALEDAKKAINKVFDPHHHQTSSDGEDDHADEWSEDEESKKEQSRWKPETSVIDPNAEFKLAKFCHECGSRYPLTEARFCCVCGVRRLTV